MDTQQLVTWLRELISANNLKAFYNSSPWLKVRLEVLKEQNHECQRCKAKGKYTKAKTVHHKKYVRKHPELALTKSNLEAICDDCHYDEHHRVTIKAQLNVERW